MTTQLPTNLLRSNPIREGWILTRRALQHWVRQPAAVIFNLLFSIMLLAIFGLLFGGAITVPGGGNYIDFLLPGMLAVTMLFGLEGTMTAITEDSKRGITDRFRSLRIHSASVALGRTGADLLSTVLDLAVLMAGGLLLGWQIGSNPASALLAVALLLWLRFAFLWLGIFLGLMFRGTGVTTAVQVLVWPIAFLSGAFVAPETMPAWLRPIAELNPVSATATAARELFGNPTGITSGILADWAIPLAIVWPLAITLVFLPLSAFAYRRLGD